MADDRPMSFMEFTMQRARKCVCGAYHIQHPHLYAIHEYDRATPERQQEMLEEIREGAKNDQPCCADQHDANK